MVNPGNMIKLINYFCFQKIWQKSNIIEYIVPKLLERGKLIQFEVRYKRENNPKDDGYFDIIIFFLINIIFKPC